MNEPTQEQHQQAMIKLLSTIWAKYPELRLGQLIENAAGQQIDEPDIFYMDDAELFKGLVSLDKWLSKSGRTSK